MWIDSVIEYDIIVETLTGTEIEVTVTDDDTIGYIKTHIQKYEGTYVVQSENYVLFMVIFETSFLFQRLQIKSIICWKLEKDLFKHSIWIM